MPTSTVSRCKLPFLQRVLGNFTFLPISLSRLALEECIELGAAIAELYEVETRANVRTIILASSDLNHYLSPGEIDKLDRLALEPILALDPSGLWEVVEEEALSMCGVLPTAVMLFARQRRWRQTGPFIEALSFR